MGVALCAVSPPIIDLIKILADFRYNIRKAQIINDPVLFKKLTNEIWEFRTLHKKLQYRLFAFWNKTNSKGTLVIATHGIVKKTDKTPKREIEKAMKIMNNYFNDL